MGCGVNNDLVEILNALSSFNSGDLKGIYHGSQVLLGYSDNLGRAVNMISSHVSSCSECMKTYERYIREIMIDDLLPYEWTSENERGIESDLLGIFNKYDLGDDGYLD